MTPRVRPSPPSARRKRGLAAVLLLLLGAVAAPVADGWLHAQERGGALGAGPGHECSLCRVSSTPALEGDGASNVDPQLPPVSRIRLGLEPDGVRATLSTAVLPPTRAPPA